VATNMGLHVKVRRTDVDSLPSCVECSHQHLKMITGDHRANAEETMVRLGMGRKVHCLCQLPPTLFNLSLLYR
jgi:hypothetical protein